MTFLKSYCFLLAPSSKWCFYRYLVYHCQANFPEIIFHTLPCSKATNGSLVCPILTPPYSGLLAIIMVHTFHLLSLSDLCYKQRARTHTHTHTHTNQSHGLYSLRRTRVIRNHGSENRGETVIMFPTPCPCSQPSFLWYCPHLSGCTESRSGNRKSEGKKKKKSHIFSSCLPKVSYQIYSFAKHQPHQF